MTGKKQELQDLDCRNRKLLTMNRGCHPGRNCVKRLYVPRREGGRGLISIDDYVNQAALLLETYIQSSEEEFLKAVRRKGVENHEWLPVSKTGGELKISKDGKRCH